MSAPVRVLHIDLSKKSSKLKVHSDLEDFLGGVGVSTALLYEYFEEFGYPERRNLDAPFVISTGPFCGLYPGGQMVNVSFVSPLLRNLGQSCSANALGEKLRGNGVDALFVSGRAEKPYYVVVRETEAHFERAGILWGMSTSETLAQLEEKHPLSVRAVIGPAGEQGVRFSSVLVSGNRSFQRGGLGAVWGKKNLKAIVVESRGKMREIDSQKYESAKEAITKKLSDPRPDSVRFNLRSQSEKNWVLEADHRGLPSLNFSQMDRSYDSLRRAIFSEISEKNSCQGCPVSCKDVVSHRGECLRVSYNSLVSLGPLLGIEEKDNVLALVLLARDAGLDPVSLGVALAFLTEKNSWEFGDLDTYQALIEGIVAREEPWAKELSLGVMKAMTPKSRDYAMVLSGLEMEPYFNGSLSTLSQIVAAEDSFDSNLAHLLDFKELEKSQVVETLVAEEKRGLVLASLAVCPLLRCVYDTSQIFSCLEGLGLNWKHEDLEALGTKIYNLKWKLKSELGFSWEDLHLPQRLFAVPTATGYMEESNLREMITVYKEQLVGI